MSQEIVNKKVFVNHTVIDVQEVFEKDRIQKKMRNQVLIFSAPSGAGKTTIVRHLLEKFDFLEFSVSATSRSPRGKEQDGIDYYFLSVDEFKKRVNNNEFVEYEEVYPGSFYGTLRSEVERIWKKGNTILFDVDVKGGMNIKKIFGEKALSVFIQPPSLEIMEERLRNRGTDSEEAIKTRISKAKQEMTFASEFDTILINDKLEDSFEKAETLVRDFCYKTNTIKNK